MSDAAGPIKRKLIEVALPLEAISKANRADKDRKTGSIRNLHKWFAPMPSPAWRALITAAILDDPEDPARRQDLLRVIESLVPSDGSEPTAADLEDARRLIKEAGAPEAVVDPFAGGGSTLVEAARLGLPVVGTDLNPVAALITRFLADTAPKVEDCPPIFSTGRLATGADSRFAGFINDSLSYAKAIRAEVYGDLEELYPGSPKEQPIGWLWAHTVPCPNPACATRVPLVSSTTLLKQRGRHFYLRFRVADKKVATSIVGDVASASKPTKLPGSKAKFACPACAEGFNADYVKDCAQDDLMGEQLMCSIYDTPAGRVFIAPDGIIEPMKLDVPETLPMLDIRDGALGFRVQPYGYTNYADLFTRRQQHALAAFADAVANLPSRITSDGGEAKYTAAITTFLGLCVGRMAQGMSRQVRWRVDPRSGSATAEATFSRQTLPMVWDYVETNPFGGSTGDWLLQVKNASRAMRHIPEAVPAKVRVSDARSAAKHYPNGRCLIATDPPYFDAIGYADLSDYFYLWLRSAMRNLHPDLFATISAPKEGELIADPSRFGGNEGAAYRYFVSGFTEVFKSLSEASDPSLPMIVIYAQRQEEASNPTATGTGWEALLEAMMEAGLIITGTWPIHGTGSTRQRVLASNALASYIVLTCRPGRNLGGATTRRAFLAALRDKLPQSVRELQEASTAPVDLSQASIGPGMSIFSRFASVVEADGSRMTVRTALSLINQVLDEVLSDQENDFDLDTRFCLKWFGQFGWDEQPYGRADDLARSTNTSVEGLIRGGAFWARGGRARLIQPAEMSPEWDPATDDRVSVWEVVLRLAKALNEQGAETTARLMAAAGERVELDAVKELAYLLFSICEKRGWTQSALLFNGLGTSWSDLSAAARTRESVTPAPAQGEFDFSNGEE